MAKQERRKWKSVKRLGWWEWKAREISLEFNLLCLKLFYFDVECKWHEGVDRDF